MCRTISCFAVICVIAWLSSGCGPISSGGSAAKADLQTIWDTCKDYYRKTDSMPPRSEIPGELAAIYNYEMTAGISLYQRSTNVIAYESRPTNGKRYVLFSDGRIEQLTDVQLREVQVDPNPQ